jgi:membrane protease YdiL (CAAX protease family)
MIDEHIDRTQTHVLAPNVYLEPWIYLGALGLTELVANLWQPVFGLWLHALLFAALILRGVRTIDEPDGQFYLVASVMPLVRIVSFAVSPRFVPGVWYYAAAEAPILAAALTAVRVLHVPRLALGWKRPRSLPLSGLVIGSGVIAGWVESHIIHPPALVSGWHLAQIVPSALLLILCTGFVEEIVFRGVIQYTAVQWLGVVPGIFYTAVGWALLHIGWASVLDLGFVLVIGLIWGAVRQWNGSILDLAPAHGIANVMLFLILPNTHF